MTEIVEHEKDSHDGQRSGIESKRDERNERTEWEPTRPHETIADASEGTSEGCTKAFDQLRCDAIELGAGERANSQTGEIGMRVEIPRVPCERLSVLLPPAPPGQQS